MPPLRLPSFPTHPGGHGNNPHPMLPRRRTGIRTGRDGYNGTAAANGSGVPTPGGGGGHGGQPAGCPVGRGGRETVAGPRRVAGPRPRASEWCKLGCQSSPPPAGPSGVGGSQGPAWQAKCLPKDVGAQPQHTASLLWASPAVVTVPRDEEQGGAPRPREVHALPARGTEGPTTRTPEPLARVLLSRRVH